MPVRCSCMQEGAPIPVIVNRQGGTASAEGEGLRDQLAEAFAGAGLEADIRLVEGQEVAGMVRELSDRPLVVVGGGDGTIGGAAFARAEAGQGALGILPLGTRNHLARELGIPLTLPEAAATIAAGETRRIDLAEVNGHGFVNNASIGVYPLLVRAREAHRSRVALPKWLATIPAAFGTLRRLPYHRLRLEMDGAPHPVRTALLFVGNNFYSLEAGRVGERVALDDGKLSVLAVAAGSRMGLVTAGLRLMAGRGDKERDFAAIGECATLTVRSRRGSIDVALDGEVVRLKLPLEFRIRHKALTVVAPPQA